MEKAYRLTRQQLYDLVWTRSLKALSTEFGITNNALAKICDRLLIPHPPRGYWSGSGAGARRTAPRPPLPPAPADCDTDVIISTQRAASRRGRTRMSLTARRDQIVEAASRLIVAEGLAATTMKRIAREVGISEALVYFYFPSQIELLTFIAREEQDEMSRSQQAAIDEHTDYVERVRASQVGYLNYVDRKGGLLQILLGSAEVRAALRPEHRSRRAWASVASAANMTNMIGVDPSLAVPGTQVMRALGVRVGKLLAHRKIDRALAGRLALAIMDGARSGLVGLDAAKSAKGSAGPRARPTASRGTSAAPGRRPSA